MPIFRKLPIVPWVGTVLLLGLTGCQTSSVSSPALVGSQRFNYVLTGNEGPLLVFQSGLGDDRSTWAPLLDRLPHDQRRLTYDRPGYGASAGTTAPRDPESIARELHGLLHELKLPPPYVLVGHSLGGLYQYAFLKSYPDEVAGLVLIDPTHPEHWRRMQRDAPVQAGMLKALRLTMFSGAARKEFDAQEGSPTLVQGIAGAPPAILLFSGRRRPEEHGAFETMLNSLRADWLRLLPGAAVVDVREAGHYVHTEQPVVVADHIERLCVQLGARRPTSVP